MTAKVSILLRGYSYSSPEEGSLGFCGVYLVEAPGPWRLVFDTGHAGRRRALLRALAGRGLSPADIDVVVLSHGHWDHVQNVDVFTRSLIYAQQDLDAPEPGDPVTPSWTPATLAGLRTRLVRDGDEPASGVTVLALPGHTAGSIGLAVATDDGLAVLTGDAVSSAHALRTGRCTVARHDPDAADRSLRRVADLADVIYPGHDHPFRVGNGVPGDYLAPVRSIVLRGSDPARAAVRLPGTSMWRGRTWSR
ncbi:MBL fold metallo-hydrolase [Actinoplanes sp. NPDC051411]|uniref:MBL fold metallo-hydrolase n=1 Tax=Actinoplanes sp. NPDC051411 TaxID=3155522 RepID=UPI00343439BB